MMKKKKFDRNDKRELLAKFKAPFDLHLTASGIVAEVVRPPIGAWFAAGAVPEFLYNEAMQVPQGDAAATTEAVKSLPAVFEFALRLARASIKWPRLTEEGKAADGDDELDPAMLPPEDLTTILMWGMGRTGTIETTGGEVDASASSLFREASAVSSDSGGVSDVRAASGAGVGDS